jgi:hypothetical protein
MAFLSYDDFQRVLDSAYRKVVSKIGTDSVVTYDPNGEVIEQPLLSRDKELCFLLTSMSLSDMINWEALYKQHGDLDEEALLRTYESKYSVAMMKFMV